MTPTKNAFWFIFFLLLGVSCLDDPDCYQLNNNTIGIAFKVAGFGDDSISYLFGDQTIRSINVTSPSASEIIISDFKSTFKAPRIPKFNLPLNLLEEEMVFQFQKGAETRFLRVGYNRQVQFVSQDCGERYIYSDLKVLENDFDSIRIVNSKPIPLPNKTTDGGQPDFETNIEIYRCPVTTSRVGIHFNKSVGINGKQVYEYYDDLNSDLDTTVITIPLHSGPKTVAFSYIRTTIKLPKCDDRIFFSELALVEKKTSLEADTMKIVKNSTQDPPVINLEITQ